MKKDKQKKKKKNISRRIDSTETITLKPFTSKGEVFVSSEGRVTLECINLFQHNNNVYLRIGENMYYFPKGVYDGSEHRIRKTNVNMIDGKRVYSNEEAATSIALLLKSSISNRNELPDDTYFEAGTKGWTEEIG